MPRPGPRPYECVRRAWHSDRHQPIRGSVIQEIFRVVNEVHSSATRKNREWQEKLPIVVLKAEEIMYSKANSEAEYSDLKTLWDRVNDAINTIIRSDDTTESGEQLLQPCIEAALHLGCTPRRSSRSQRNDSPRCYLRPETLQNNTPPVSVSVPNHNPNTSKIYGNSKPIVTPLVLHHPQLSPLHRPVNPLNSIQNRTCNPIKRFPDNFTPDHSHRAAAAQASASSATWSIYPLYYNNNNNNNNYNPIQPDERKVCPVQHASDFIYPYNHECSPSRVQGGECDLTLRLGSLVGNAERGTAEVKRFKSHPNK